MWLWRFGDAWPRNCPRLRVEPGLGPVSAGCAAAAAARGALQDGLPYLAVLMCRSACVRASLRAIGYRVACSGTTVQS